MKWSHNYRIDNRDLNLNFKVICNWIRVKFFCFLDKDRTIASELKIFKSFMVTEFCGTYFGKCQRWWTTSEIGKQNYFPAQFTQHGLLTNVRFMSFGQGIACRNWLNVKYLLLLFFLTAPKFYNLGHIQGIIRVP